MCISSDRRPSFAVLLRADRDAPAVSATQNTQHERPRSWSSDGLSLILSMCTPDHACSMQHKPEGAMNVRRATPNCNFSYNIVACNTCKLGHLSASFHATSARGKDGESALVLMEVKVVLERWRLVPQLTERTADVSELVTTWRGEGGSIKC